MPRQKAKRNAKTLDISMQTDKDACFVSPYRNYRWVGQSEDRKYDPMGHDVKVEGMALQFEEGVGRTDDMEIVSAMLMDSKCFGVDFCIDPADRSGFWKEFREAYPDAKLAEYFPTGIPKALNTEMAGNILQAISRAAGTVKTSRGVIHVAKGRVPIKDGGRERLGEDQEAALAALQE